MPETGSNVEIAQQMHEHGHAAGRKRLWIEIGEAVLLALVAVATAWSGYQSAQWDGHEAEQYATSAHLRFVDELARMLRTQFSLPNGRRLSAARAEALAAFTAGLGIEIGRVVVGAGARPSRAIVAHMIALARDAAAAAERAR